ncbi:MAG: hypothetical protein GDA52_06880, partial [Rhodobacteraceae bacterium]|nr:hypothetical protein [Paracoccaceae bacterium]
HEIDAHNEGMHDEFDAPTRFALRWYAQFGYEQGDFGFADTMARAQGISVDAITRERVIIARAGKVALTQRDALGEAPDLQKCPAWMACQYLINAYEEGGEREAARTIKRMGGEQAAHVNALAYAMHGHCEKRKDAQEAVFYNGLVGVWTDLVVEAARLPDEQQMSMQIKEV